MSSNVYVLKTDFNIILNHLGFPGVAVRLFPTESLHKLCGSSECRIPSSVWRG